MKTPFENPREEWVKEDPEYFVLRRMIPSNRRKAGDQSFFQSQPFDKAWAKHLAEMIQLSKDTPADQQKPEIRDALLSSMIYAARTEEFEGEMLALLTLEEILKL